MNKPSKTFILAFFIVFFAFSGVITPSSVQAQSVNTSELVDELKNQAQETDITQTLDSDTYIKSENWDAQNNTAYLTIVSSNSEQLTIYDFGAFSDGQNVQYQRYTIQGEQTIQVDVSSIGGRQSLFIGTEDSPNKVVSVKGIDWQAQENILLVSLVTALLLVIYTLYNWWRKDQKEDRGVWDLVTKGWIETTQESDTMEIERWRDYPAYLWVRIKESSVKIAEKPFKIGLIGALILIADRLLLSGYIYYTLIDNSYIGTKLMVLFIGGTLFSYPASLYIVKKKYPLRRIPILVLDWGEIGAQDLEDVLDPSTEIENIHESVRLVEMSDTVYKRFNIKIEDSLAEIPYGETNKKMKIARRIDFDENEILPNWQQLNSQKKVMEHQSYAKLNTKLIKDYVRKVQTQISRIAGYKEKTRQEQTRQVAKDISQVLSGDSTEAGQEIEQLTEALLKSDAMEKKVGDVEQEDSISEFDSASLSDIVPDPNSLTPEEGDTDE